MRAEPWGLVRTDHGSSTIRCTPSYKVRNVRDKFAILTFFIPHNYGYFSELQVSKSQNGEKLYLFIYSVAETGFHSVVMFIS